MKTRLIEKNIFDGAYGFSVIEAIIESEKYGKLLIMQGYGGEGTMAGGAMRWRHGMAIKLEESDTIGSLNEPGGEDGLSRLERTVGGFGGDLDILELNGKSIIALSASAGVF